MPPTPADAGTPLRRPSTRRRWLVGLAQVGTAIGPAQALTQPDLETLDVGGGRIELQFEPGFDASMRTALRAWVQRSAEAATGYFGRFPAARVELLIRATDGSGIGQGVTYAEPELHIGVRVGRETTAAVLHDDWIMVHEMIHLAIPRVPRSQNWLHEGLATYVEGVARGRAGLVAPATVWHEWFNDMPQGQPRAGDAGLDHTPTWGRTYWGGAIFCLMADVQLLRATAGRLGLQQALRAVLRAGGNYAVAWPVERILHTADAGVGQGVLTDLYGRMKGSSEPADLDGLWRDLGVTAGGFDETAPGAAVRRAILA